MISKDDVIRVQEQWANTIVKIGSLKGDLAECEIEVDQCLSQLYAYDTKTVLFKPTKTSEKQFRLDKLGAKSYFMGNNPSFEEDKGFALQPWTRVRFENKQFILEEKRAIAMGNYFFTDLINNEIKVEYTFGYVLIDGKLKIDLHHSSIPYNPN